MATSEFVSDISKPSHVSNTLGKKRNGTKRQAMPGSVTGENTTGAHDRAPLSSPRENRPQQRTMVTPEVGTREGGEERSMIPREEVSGGRAVERSTRRTL